MYTKILFVFVTLFVVVACNHSKDSDKNSSPDSDPTCYLFSQGRDSIKLSVLNRAGEISGTFDFLFYEKDKSRGTIQGQMKGDTLVASYTFTSEGVRSSREVMLLKKDDSFVLGSGDMESNADQEVFRDRAGVRFDTGPVLRKTSDCN